VQQQQQDDVQQQQQQQQQQGDVVQQQWNSGERWLHMILSKEKGLFGWLLAHEIHASADLVIYYDRGVPQNSRRARFLLSRSA
jgi:hypothetical protein